MSAGLGDRMTIRLTDRQRRIIEQWLDAHPGRADEPMTASDALRAALDALEILERRRAAARADSRTYTRPVRR